MSDSLQPYGLQHSRFLCPTLSLRVGSNLCPLSWWCYLTISSSATFFSFCFQSFLASRSFPLSRLFLSGGQSIGASTLASVLSVNIQGWFPLGLTGLISLLSEGLSRVFSSTIDWKHKFFGAQPSFWSAIAFSSVQSLSRVWLFPTPWIAACQASLSITISRSSLKLTCIELVMPFSHLILCCPLPPAPNPSQHQSLFQWVNSSHEVTRVLEFQLYHHSLQRTPRADLL